MLANPARLKPPPSPLLEHGVGVVQIENLCLRGGRTRASVKNRRIISKIFCLRAGATHKWGAKLPDEKGVRTSAPGGSATLENYLNTLANGVNLNFDTWMLIIQIRTVLRPVIIACNYFSIIGDYCSFDRKKSLMFAILFHGKVLVIPVDK